MEADDEQLLEGEELLAFAREVAAEVRPQLDEIREISAPMLAEVLLTFEQDFEQDSKPGFRARLRALIRTFAPSLRFWS